MLKQLIVKKFQELYPQTWKALGDVQRARVGELAGQYTGLFTHFIGDECDHELYMGQKREKQADGLAVRVLPGEQCEKFAAMEVALDAARSEFGTPNIELEFLHAANEALYEVLRQATAWNFRERLILERAKQ